LPAAERGANVKTWTFEREQTVAVEKKLQFELFRG
jgi:hypothetical protein